MELNPRLTLLHPQAILGETGMLRFGKLLIRKVPRERGVLTRDRSKHSPEPHSCPSNRRRGPHLHPGTHSEAEAASTSRMAGARPRPPSRLWRRPKLGK